MNLTAEDLLGTLFRSNGLGWMIDQYSPKEKAIEHYSQLLDQIACEYRTRCGESFLFSPKNLQAESVRNPHKVQAFLQLLHPNRSPVMMVMVWRVLQGFSIREVNFNYRELDTFFLKFTIAAIDDHENEIIETYETNEIGDSALIKHLGFTKVGEKPLFDGFYALKSNKKNK